MANGNKITPPLTSKGIFEVQEPFQLNQKRVYEVIAIREFPDLWAEHIDVYETYYRPHGLSDQDYSRDSGVGAAIVSLLGDDGVHHIPDTYFISYPELGLANYHHVVLSLSIGPISKSRNLDGLKKELEQIASKFLGVTGVARIHTAPVKEAITQTQADKLEQVRQGNINIPETDTLKYRQEKARNDALVATTNNALLARFKQK